MLYALECNENDTLVIIESEGRTNVGVMMKEQDKRVVESMCRCGMDIEGVIAVFPNFPKEEVMDFAKMVVKIIDPNVRCETLLYWDLFF